MMHKNKRTNTTEMVKVTQSSEAAHRRNTKNTKKNGVIAESESASVNAHLTNKPLIQSFY